MRLKKKEKSMINQSKDWTRYWNGVWRASPSLRKAEYEKYEETWKQYYPGFNKKTNRIERTSRNLKNGFNTTMICPTISIKQYLSRSVGRYHCSGLKFKSTIIVKSMGQQNTHGMSPNAEGWYREYLRGNMDLLIHAKHVTRSQRIQ